MKRLVGLIWVLLALGGCVPKKRYEEVVAENALLSADVERLHGEIARARQDVARIENELRATEGALEATNRKLAAKTAETGVLQDDLGRMQAALAEAEHRKQQADLSLAAYRDLVSRFQSLIDAGTLEVRVIDGRMLVVLATDVLFPAGASSLSKEGHEAVRAVAGVLASIPGRSYQVAGHTDDVPINTERFPSNWHLGAARAISVVQVLVEGGLASDRVSAASYAETQPGDTNRTKEGRAANRRIEIAIVPDLSLMPGYEDLQKVGGGSL